MGTKVEYGIDVLVASTKRTSFSSVHSTVDESSDSYYRSTQSDHQGLKKIKNNQSFQITGLIDHKYQMMNNKMTENHNNIHFIRNTMQIHEDIFKQQVKELHRLYSVQKILMEEMKKKNKLIKHKNYSNNMDNYDYRLKLREDNNNEMSPRESCSGDHHNHNQTSKKKIKTGSSVVNVNVTADHQDYVSTSKINEVNDDHDEEEDEIELTLSIGGPKGRSSKKLKNEQLLLLQEEHQSTSTTTSSTTTTPTFDQQKKPHWLFQGLSINNRTSSSTG